MKLQILSAIYEQPLEGFYPVFFHAPDGLDPLHIVDQEAADNECDVILAPEIMSYIPYSAYASAISLLLKKLRIGGELIIGGTEIGAFGNNALTISSEDANLIIAKSTSMAEVNNVCELVRQLTGEGYQITWSCTGVHYEIKIRRV